MGIIWDVMELCGFNGKMETYINTCKYIEISINICKYL